MFVIVHKLTRFHCSILVSCAGYVRECSQILSYMPVDNALGFTLCIIYM